MIVTTKKIRLLAVLAVITVLPPAIGAELTGKVTLRGTPPPEIPIPLDEKCSKVQPEKITTRHYVVSPDGGLANVFVWIKKGVTGKYDPPTKPAELDQKGCEYVPYVQGIQTGQPLKIVNSDPFLHNVDCQANKNQRFNLAQVVKGQTSTKVFDHQEVMVKFKCDVHIWMFAYVGVVDHPFFSVTDQEGHYKISNLPAGKYTIEAYHLKAGKQTQEITVGADDTKQINFTFEPPKRK